MGVVVTLDRMTDLSAADHAAVAALTRAVYPPESAAGWAGRAVEWSEPGWGVRVHAGGALVAFAGVYLRAATVDGRPTVVGGVGNVKTHPAARGRGHAAAAVRRAAAFLRDAGAAFGLLVCEPPLVGYYARLGWTPFGGRLVVRQRGVIAEYTLGPVMTLGLRAAGPAAGVADLCGPPW